MLSTVSTVRTMSLSAEVTQPVKYLGLTADEFFTNFRSLADASRYNSKHIRSYIDFVIPQIEKFGIPCKSSKQAVAWFTDFRDFNFEEEPLHVFFQTKEYRYGGITIPVHSPLESLAYALSLVEPPNDAEKTSWYEIWAVCIARLIGIASPAQAPVTFTLLHPSPWFQLPPTWESKYLIGTSLPLRLIDLTGQLIVHRKEADEKRNLIQRERCRLANKCGAELPGQESDKPYFVTDSGFRRLVGLCASHVPSCIILKTIPAENATHFNRLAIRVDTVAKIRNMSTRSEVDWQRFLQDTCINCIDGYCNPAGYAAANPSRTGARSGLSKKLRNLF